MSTNCTTWSCSSGPCGNRTRLSGLRGRRPVPIDERAMLSVRRAGVEPAQPEGWLGYSHLGSPMPSRRMFSSGAGGSRTRTSPRFELGRFADLRTAPCFSKAPSTGFEPAISCVTGRRALQAAPRGRFVSNGSGGTRTHSIPGQPFGSVPEPRWSANLPTGPCPGQESNLQPPGFKPSRSSDWRTWASQWSRMESNHRFLGVGQVSWPLDYGTVHSSRVTGNRTRISELADAGVVLLDHDLEAEAVGLEPTSGEVPPPAFQAGSSTIRMASVIQAAGAGIEPT